MSSPIALRCRPLRGGVDRNNRGVSFAMMASRRPLRGSVDRNQIRCGTHESGGCRPLRGGVDRNDMVEVAKVMDRQSPSVWGRG